MAGAFWGTRKSGSNKCSMTPRPVRDSPLLQPKKKNQGESHHRDGQNNKKPTGRCSRGLSIAAWSRGCVPRSDTRMFLRLRPHPRPAHSKSELPCEMLPPFMAPSFLQHLRKIVHPAPQMLCALISGSRGLLTKFFAFNRANPCERITCKQCPARSPAAGCWGRAVPPARIHGRLARACPAALLR